MKIFVAEVVFNGMKETWTVSANNRSDARRVLEGAAGTRPVMVAEATGVPTRHWKAG